MSHSYWQRGLRVDLAGFRDSVAVQVVADSAATTLDEDWAVLDTMRWLPFGSPRPFLDRGPRGVAGLNNGGDGSYPSGVFSAALYGVTGGLGLEARVSIPVTRSQWQQLQLSIVSARAWPVERWDRLTGSPARVSFGSEACGAGYPNGEGLAAVGSVAAIAGGQGRVAPADSTWRLGAWHRIRLQVFPDGECGVAIDGVPIWRSPGRLPLDQQYRVLLAGSSAGTKVLVGPFQVWRGVRKDIDWSVVDRRQ